MSTDTTAPRGVTAVDERAARSAEVRRFAYRMRHNVLNMGEEQGQGYVGQALGAADMLAAIYANRLRYRADDPSPYDDTGWSLDKLRHVTVYTVNDSSVLTRPMQRVAADARAAGAVAGAGPTLAVPPLGDWRSATLPWQVGGARVTVADTAFAAGCLPLGHTLTRTGSTS